MIRDAIRDRRRFLQHCAEAIEWLELAIATPADAWLPDEWDRDPEQNTWLPWEVRS